MNESKIVNVITVPIVCFKGEILWGVMDMYGGKKRDHVRNFPSGGQQILETLMRVLDQDSYILIVADDKFNRERLKDEDPTREDFENFLKAQPLPSLFMKLIEGKNAFTRLVVPPSNIACTPYSFSEAKLFKAGKKTLGYMGSECANEWVYLMDWIDSLPAYESIKAYIPLVCEKGVCLANWFLTLESFRKKFTKPFEVLFTNKHGGLASKTSTNTAPNA